MARWIMMMKNVAQLDYVIGTIVLKTFNQSEEQIMERLANGIGNPYVRHIAHPTGRTIGRRDGYKPNIEQLMALAEETNTVLEINTEIHIDWI